MWKPLPPTEWRKFKAEKLKKWLNPVSLDSYTYKKADERYENFMKQKRLMKELLEELGEKVSDWELKAGPERKAGWRGQEWFFNLLMDLQVANIPELKTPYLSEEFFKVDLKKLGLTTQDWRSLYYNLGIGSDINIFNFGTIEIKTMKAEAERFNVKKDSWDSRPSLYLAVLRNYDKEMLEFQFLGWLYGMQVYKLRVQPENKFYPAYYFGELKELRKPEAFLKMLFKISRAKPISRP
jgi:hypothetical protein